MANCFQRCHGSNKIVPDKSRKKICPERLATQNRLNATISAESRKRKRLSGGDDDAEEESDGESVGMGSLFDFAGQTQEWRGPDDGDDDGNDGNDYGSAFPSMASV